MTTVNNTVMNNEQRIEELEKSVKGLSIALTHACLLIDENMATTVDLMEILHNHLDNPETEAVNVIVDRHVEKTEKIQKHFEGLHKQLDDGTLEI